ncbi:hypothetical protein CP533_4693 [Ophiocordyceps camponoti-saundersi (nom. inval.)]|nr:hypothetical protein CP533_4693 [Ophiocordyceps camponoti-saundersi (nom. inval.)]
MESAIAHVDLGRYRRFMQMIWDPEPANDIVLDQPVWCLGAKYQLSDATVDETGGGCDPDPLSSSRKSYHRLLQPSQRGVKDYSVNLADAPASQLSPGSFPSLPASEQASHNDDGWPLGFLHDFESRIWMTYRSGFETIPRSNDSCATSSLSLTMRIKSQLGEQGDFSSDSGWGCMIRSGQSILANSLSMLRLGRDWRRGEQRQEERHLISLFADDPRAPYSIHNFVSHGATACGKYPGQWFGPSATARCIQALVNKNDPYLRVYSTGDSPDVYEDEFMKIAKPDGVSFHPTLILVGTRLGIDKITPVYWEALTASLQMPQSVGIAGGRPSSSHYFVGVQGSFLFYLDPHHTRTALPYHKDTNSYRDDEINSCHTARLRRLHVREVDPSMLVGFLIRSQDDWQEWRRCTKHVQGKAIIHVADHALTTLTSASQAGAAIDEVQALSDDDSEISVLAA